MKKVRKNGCNYDILSEDCEVHHPGCQCEDCLDPDLEHEDYINEAEEAEAEKEAEMSEKERSWYEAVKETAEEMKKVQDAPGFLGKCVGKAAWYIAKPLDQLHKHVTEPFIDAFKEEFGNGK